MMYGMDKPKKKSKPASGKKKNKSKCETDSTRLSKTNTQRNRMCSMGLKDNSKKKSKSWKIETKSFRKKITFCNSDKSIWNNRLRHWRNRKCSCSRPLARARVKSKKTCNEWRMLWWLTTITKLISCQLRNASSRPREWLIWARPHSRTFLRFSSSLR